MKPILIILISLWFTLTALGQSKYLGYIPSSIKLSGSDTLVIIKPFVNAYLWTKSYKGEDSIKSVHYKYYLYRDTVYERFCAEGCNYVFNNHFGKKIKYSIDNVSTTDYAIVYAELKKIELRITDSTLNLVQLSVEMNGILSKYTASYLMITDIHENDSLACSVYPTGVSFVTKVFLFDLKRKKLIFYGDDGHNFKFYTDWVAKYAQAGNCLSYILRHIRFY